MGGWGSGPYGPMGDRVRRRTVEETISLSIQSLKEKLNGKVLSFSWDNGDKSIGIITKGDYILLHYKVNGEPITTRVDLDKTKVGYGERLWFNCPGCGERAARLYLKDKEFFCRECQNLTYLTCQESGDPLDYLAIKIRRLQRKLGMGKPDIYETPLFKPKNMHYKTFAKMREQLIKMQEERDAYFVSQCKSRFF